MIPKNLFARIARRRRGGFRLDFWLRAFSTDAEKPVNVGLDGNLRGWLDVIVDLRA